MAKTYRTTALRKAGNAAISVALRAGVAPSAYSLLTVAGRRTGRPRTTPVRVMRSGERRWLVAPYGVVDWVRNVRAAGQVTLTRGRHSDAYAAVECDAEQSGPVLKDYARLEPVTRPYFDAKPADPPERFAAEADRHPVFRLEPLDPDADGER
ncbi:nitroreductase family deazaflavin-dependent oxidoreductase [Jiangella asiatica]|uniref:Nitroreductase family deazaflavin-dependent oxidoreductase n=1 Tax=Jiangella asiatica TaxID=2530372 RepID=A0A4R5DA13_9ACTN|nr:nitroreductase family deazaflavin-dependent oxidoreductase [Jiangella asiatica]TDE09647.1 nitroreductase family deazaflavin-dependent oxidoreductase [Jiangella asiatica]